MPNPDSDRRRKGRPASPFQIERLTIATHLVNEGWTFKAAAEMGLILFKYDFATRQYVPDDEANAQMPETKDRRRVALYEIKRKFLTPRYRGFGPPLAQPLTEPIPLAFRIDEPLKRGRPKKKRSR